MSMGYVFVVIINLLLTVSFASRASELKMAPK